VAPSRVSVGWSGDARRSTHELNERSVARSYYAADGQLRVQQINRDSTKWNSPTDSVVGQTWGAYEEYWYDALGRRVLKRSRQESPVCAYGSSRCYSAIERYVWDGAQILWEFRQANAGDTKDPSPTPSNGQTGHVGYVHVGGIDAPLAMIRNDTTVVLHRDHRGLYYAATNTAGGLLGDSVPWPSTNWALSQYAFYPRKTHTVVRLATDRAPRPHGAALQAQPLPRPGLGAVHAARSHRVRGGAESVWLCGGRSGERVGSVRAIVVLDPHHLRRLSIRRRRTHVLADM
jgi:hypothetical protein